MLLLLLYALVLLNDGFDLPLQLRYLSMLVSGELVELTPQRYVLVLKVIGFLSQTLFLFLKE